MNGLLLLSRWLGRGVLALAGITLLSIMSVTVADVIMRYLFKLTNGASGITLTGSVELVKYLLLITLLGAMTGQVERSQVVVEVFTQSMSDRLKAQLGGMFLLVFAVIGGLMTSGLIDAARSAAEFGEVSQDLGFSLSPVYGLSAILFAIFAIRSAIHGLEGLVRGVSYDI
ncbi:TRAP transporter small permease [Larsenimonas salina]|uniref:TRAP transporter small permease n=1 Tax=Larsenimonas salina TaxID=1295565 RepID=UPI002073C824|nr:TRAP transporter small permease subunit [Larsenimonas salina]MCM5704861.1 TRAP transporter small permease [Larsenimonas salina]